MTIALAIAADNGIVVAADMEETSGYLKTTDTKILSVVSNIPAGKPDPAKISEGCLIAGAGNSDYIERLKFDLADEFLGCSPTLTGSKVLQRAFERTVRDFYKDHIIPFALFPDDDRPDVGILIAAYRNYSTSLYFTNRSVVGRAMLFKAVGAGAIFAKIMLDHLWRASVQEVEILAAYVTYMVKESVESCGKYTQIATLHGPKQVLTEHGLQLHPPSPPITWMDGGRIETLEREFQTTWRKKENETIWSLIDENVEMTA
jgi:hypothetical protein